ncbi:MAG: hypothetical protein KQJ78_00660 [Deltaproteobacteria bacterium]|nr:hypothetical protein [Deltaproteobacteria bacterium]
MNKRRLWLGVLAVFACGLVLGWVAGTSYEKYESARRFQLIRSTGGLYLAQMAMKRLSAKLELTPEQAGRIAPIVEEAFREMHQLRAKLHPQFESIMREVTARMKTELTPEQTAVLVQEGDWRMLLPHSRKKGSAPTPTPPGG